MNREERDRRQIIRKVFDDAFAQKDTRKFWEVIRLAGISEQSEEALKLCERWRDLIGEAWKRNP